MNQGNDWAAVGVAVTERMDALNWDQADVVRRSGLSDPLVRGIMRGDPRGNPRDKSRRKLAESLGWSPDSIDRLLAGDDPIEVDQPTPAPTDDVTEVLALARSMREGLTKSQSRDAKLDEIIGLCEDISHHIAELTVTAVEARASAARNEAVIAALAEHFALVVDLSQA